ncbi:MAG: hypothetical protein SFX73_24120 [Kofleriaceae bacterium]|nr:hypothetical protein [Kofleriaceae bacterium]
MLPRAASARVTASADRTAARLALVERYRRFAWTLAHDAQVTTAAKLVAGKTHDLLNLVQIVQLGALDLGEKCPEESVIIDDMVRAAGDAQHQLDALMAVARPRVDHVRGPAVGPTVARVVDEMRMAIDVNAHLAIDPDTATALSDDELTYLVIGMVLDVAEAPRVELYARERTIDDVRWVELVCGVTEPVAGDHFDVRIVEVLAKRAGGELARSDRRGGGGELVVALPVQ